MIEMLGVLAIIGVLSAGGIMGYSTAMEKYQVNKLVNDVKLYATQMSNLFNDKNQKKSDAGFTKTQLCQRFDFFQKDYCAGKTPLGTPIDFRYNEFSGGLFNGGDFGQFTSVSFFAVHLFYLPKSACVKFLTQDWSNVALFTNIIGNDSSTVLWKIDTAPPSLAVAEANCDIIKNTANAYIIAYFILSGRKL